MLLSRDEELVIVEPTGISEAERWWLISVWAVDSWLLSGEAAVIGAVDGGVSSE
jgi:hypothetical protein